MGKTVHMLFQSAERQKRQTVFVQDNSVHIYEGFTRKRTDFEEDFLLFQFCGSGGGRHFQLFQNQCFLKSISAFPDLGIAPRLQYTVRHNNGKQILFLCNKYKIKAAAPETLPSLNLAKDWGKRLY
nr:hypothetical protein [uncultured Oscillibacter sp.]